MKFHCCFCGRVIETEPAYALILQKTEQKNQEDRPSQTLYCHEKCLDEKLVDPGLLYLKYL